MIVFEAKLRAESEQYRALDEAIRTARFVRNKCLRYWMDNRGVSGYDLNNYCAELAEQFEWAKKLNSMARQASAERAWSAISRFYDNCKKGVPGKKGYPKFKKHQTNLSVEYKTSGWKLSDDRLHITFTDGFCAGTFRLWGTRSLHYYQIEQIKRVRVVRRADGYYAQFCIAVDRQEKHEYQNRVTGIDLGLIHFYTDSDGNTVENPRFLRNDEKALRCAQRRVSRMKLGSKNRVKARNRLGRKLLLVARRRKDFVVKTSRALVQSNDLVAFEDLKVRNMVKNHHLAAELSKLHFVSLTWEIPFGASISDATRFAHASQTWSQFTTWVEYFGKVFGVGVVAVPPQYTSQDCSNCGVEVKKSLSTKTHTCSCGTVLDRDHNAALNILKLGLSTVGHTETNVCGENGLCVVGETEQRKPTRRSRKLKK